MRLDPVLLAAPSGPPALVPTRRAFMLGGTLFAAGLSLGGACGYAIGSRRTEGGEEVEVSTGDADLDELRRLAVKAPIEELVKHRLVFVNATFADYPKDATLWKGIGRLAEFVLSDFAMDDRRKFAAALAGVIEQADIVVSRDLRQLAPKLRRVR